MRGSIYLLIAWLFGTTMASLAKGIEPIVGVWMILFSQGVVSFVLNVPLALKHKKAISNFSSWRLVVFRTLCGYISFCCVFIAVNKTSLVNVVLLDNTAPIFIPIAAYFWLKSKIPAVLWTGILIGFVGILFILQPGLDIFQQHGILLALAAGVFLALIQLSIRLMAVKDHAYAILFYFFLMYAVLSAPLALAYWSIPNWKIALTLLACGVSSFGMQVGFVKAFTYAKPTEIGPLNYSAVVFAYLMGLFIWGQDVSMLSLLGICLVVFGGILTIYLDSHVQSKSKL
jgi:drug/metabolite transporter (DMT)-like permease